MARLQSHQDRIDAGIGFDWSEVPDAPPSLQDVPATVDRLNYYREKNSHKGVSKFTRLNCLWAHKVNQDFLEEVCQLTNLETLYIEQASVADLSPLLTLTKLRNLIIHGGTKITSLEWAPELKSLRALAIENFKRVEKLNPLADMTFLNTLAVEGSMWTRMRVESLAPISNLVDLRYLFLTNFRPADGLLEPLHQLKGLRVLQCADFYKKGEMQRLATALPNLKCSWLDEFRK